MSYLWTDSEWTFPLIEKTYKAIERIALDELKLDCYPNDIEIINSEQMLDAYSSVGMPVFYKHWSFGKHFTYQQQLYSSGMQGLAYEIVINSNPCISYLMEENTMTMQALVMAHACFGHNTFFKTNALFKMWTDADSIIDYLVFAKDYIFKCEEHEGRLEVEKFLDSCHAMMSYGVDRYKRPSKLSAAKERLRQADRDDFAQKRVNELFDRLLKPSGKPEDVVFPTEPQENILYFCEKYAPDLKNWQREILRIVRKISQYFYPQSQTKTMNEGCLVEGSLIETSDGLIPIEKIVRDKKITAVWDGETWRKVYDWFEHAPKRRIKLTTHHGYEIHGGADHKILVKGEWKTLDEINIGDVLSIEHQNHVFAQDYVDLPVVNFSLHLSHKQISDYTGIPPSYFESVKNNRHACSEKYTANFDLHDTLVSEHVENRFDQSTENLITAPTVLNEDFAYWLGVLIGDGSMSEKHRYVTIVNADTELLDNWQNIGTKLFGLAARRVQEYSEDGSLSKERIFFYSMTLIRWLRDNFDIKVGYAAPCKEIPSLVLQSPKSVIASFLRGLFDADGCATKQKGGQVIYISRSKKLVQTVQHVLLKFGIICRITLQKDNCYRLAIGGSNAIIFANQIGFGLTRKQDMLMNKISEAKIRKNRIITTKVVSKNEDYGTTFDFSVDVSHRYSSGAFIHHNCATYTHYRIMHRLHEQGLMTNGSWLEFIQSHTNVIFQPEYNDRRYSGINPYALGFAMMRDIERICKSPTDEDRKWFPDFAGCGDEMSILKNAWKNYRDESFIRQFLSPKIIRDFKLFRVKDSHKEPNLVVSAIHNDRGYDDIRASLADQYEIHNRQPQLEIVRVNPKTKLLEIRYKPYRGRMLKDADVMAHHIQNLWGGYPILLRDDKGNTIFSQD